MKSLTEANTSVLVNANTKFISSKVMSTQTEFVDMGEKGTAGTDGKKVMINPPFWDGLSLRQRVFVLVHEQFHILFKHPHWTAKLGYDHELANIAQDTVINAIEQMGNIGETIPGIIQCDDNGNVVLRINGKELEIKEAHKKNFIDVYCQILQHIEKNPPKNGKGRPLEDKNQKGFGDKGTPGKHEVKDGKGNTLKPLDDHQAGELTKEESDGIDRSLRQMVTESKMKGTMPSFLQDMLMEFLTPKVNWKALLKDKMAPMFRSYNTFARPHRRSQALGYIIPGPLKSGIELTVAVDTSGSIGVVEANQFMTEIVTIVKSFPKSKVDMTVMLHTTDVYLQQKVKEISDVKKLKISSGGTSHKDVFEKAEKIRTKLLVCLTDGYSDYPYKTKIPKVIFICTEKNGSVPSFATRIDIKIEDIGGKQ